MIFVNYDMSNKCRTLEIYHFTIFYFVVNFCCSTFSLGFVEILGTTAIYEINYFVKYTSYAISICIHVYMFIHALFLLKEY